MGIPKIKSHSFYFDFFEKGKLPEFYSEIKNVPKEYVSPNRDLDNDIHIVNCIPPFVLQDQKALKNGLKAFTKTYRLGYAMYLPEFTNANDFLRNQLGKKPFKNLRQDYQRLKRDHNVQVKIYFGEIDRKIYKELFIKLEEFIHSRFTKNNRKHFALTKWSFYKETVYQDIHDKKASFFVVYSDSEPIAISLSYHFRNVMFAAVTSFNNTYNHYSLGRQMFVEQINWCYQNGIELLDTGWGEFDYKMKFSNAVYQYHTQVIYPERNTISKMASYIISTIMMLKSKVSTFYHLGCKSYKKLFTERLVKLENFLIASENSDPI